MADSRNGPAQKLLFICAHNKDRSVTAATLFDGNVHFEVRARGVSKRAAVQVSGEDLDWADTIFVMEGKHEKRLRREYRSLLKERNIVVLGVPDDFKCMDASLVDLLKSKMAQVLDL